MRTIADLINEWIEAKPNRSAAGLSRATGVPKSTISSILAGRNPSLLVALKLGMVLPVNQIYEVIIAYEPTFARFMERADISHKGPAHPF